MYTRSYFTEDKRVAVPENYDGNAFEKDSEQPRAVSKDTECLLGATEPTPPCENDKNASLGVFSSILEKIPIKSFFKGISLPIFKSDENGKRTAQPGTEEILICAAMLYLFFSKDGDKECAIMLFLLLFIH